MAGPDPATQPAAPAAHARLVGESAALQAVTAKYRHGTLGGHMTAEPATREQLLEYEQKAERAYAAMYDAPSHNQKDLKDDALFCLARAVEVAETLGLAEDAARLRARIENIMGVYNSQFRGNFR